MVHTFFNYQTFPYLYYMTELDIISLQSAKDFLVVDYDDRDQEITRHIKAAVAWIERYTKVMLYQRDKTYTLNGCSLEIYDFPLTISGDWKTKGNVLSTTVYGQAGDSFTASVGYDTADSVPTPLIEAAYKLILYLFENKDVYTAVLPMDVQVLVNQYRRSATI